MPPTLDSFRKAIVFLSSVDGFEEPIECLKKELYFLEQDATIRIAAEQIRKSGVFRAITKSDLRKAEKILREQEKKARKRKK